MTKTVSCVIPSGGAHFHFKEAIASVLAQTSTPFEIIVINNSPETLSLHQDLDPRIKIYDFTETRGAAAARNFGAARASGDYLAFLDDDDLWPAVYLENVQKALMLDAKCVISRLDKLENGQILPFKNPAGGLILDQLLVRNPGITGSNVVIDREIFVKIGGFDAQLPVSEDKALVIELLQRQIPVVILPENHAIIRIYNSANRLSQDPRKMAAGIKIFTKKYGRLMTVRQKIKNWLKIFWYQRQNLMSGRHFMVRPSKSFLYDLLDKELSQMEGDVGLDAASANFNNRRMFRTKYYYGLDYDRELIKRGLKKYQEPNTFGIHADMVNLSAIAEGCVDAVVSTNTLHQMSVANRKLALLGLCRICSPAGRLMCEMDLDEDWDAMREIISSRFSEIKIFYYSNPISRFYESIFEKDGFLGSHPVAGRRPFRLLSWLISRIEYLTCKIRGINRHVFVIAKKKRGSLSPKKFDLSNLPPPQDRIFEMMNHDS